MECRLNEIEVSHIHLQQTRVSTYRHYTAARLMSILSILKKAHRSMKSMTKNVLGSQKKASSRTLTLMNLRPFLSTSRHHSCITLIYDGRSVMTLYGENGLPYCYFFGTSDDNQVACRSHDLVWIAHPTDVEVHLALSDHSP